MVSREVRFRALDIIDPDKKIIALEGGIPVRATRLPYGLQYVNDEDIEAVTKVLRSDWITTGPKVKEFEEATARYVGAKYAVSFSSGTAALHGAAYAAKLGSGDPSKVKTGKDPETGILIIDDDPMWIWEREDASGMIIRLVLDKQYGYFMNILQGDYEIMDYELGGQENEIVIIQSGG